MPARSMTVRIVTILLLALPMFSAAAEPPLVGLAGHKYRLAWVNTIEQLGGRSELISGAELESPEAIARYDALIIETSGDPGQEEWGLTPTASAVVTEFVNRGGRVLCEYGCAPPREIIGGSWAIPGRGPHWLVRNVTHPITEGMTEGAVVRYGAYRFRVADAPAPAQVLLTEPDGSPALIVIEHGDGVVVQCCGSLGAGHGYDGTTLELADRVLRYLMYGRVQERFGDPLPETMPTKALDFPVVHTPRELGVETVASAARLLTRDFADPPDWEPSGGYRARIEGAGPGAVWTVTAPPGDVRFAPWVHVPMGHVAIEAGRRYTLSLRARLIDLNAAVFAPVHGRLRFYRADGTEIPHDTISTDVVPATGEWTRVAVEAIAPEGAVRAAAILAAMIPGGRLELDTLSLERTLAPEEVFAREEPLTSRLDGHPRAILSPERAATLAQVAAVTDDRFGKSPAEVFATISARAAGYLEETEIAFGDTTIPWPPSELPDVGGGLSWNPMVGAIGERLKSLALVYAVTGDERYGRRAIELLLAVSNWPQWYDPQNGYLSLDIGNMSVAVAWAYDLCHDLMTDEERARAASAIQRNALVPLYQKLSGGVGNTNGWALWTTAMGLCAIATLGEVEGSATCARLAEHAMLDYFDQRATRHRTEGQGYDAWAYGLLIFLADSLRRNFEVDHLGHPFLPVIPRFAVGFLANDRVHQAWFADAGGSVAYVPWHFPLTLLGTWTGNGLAGWYLQETATFGSPSYDHFKLVAADLERIPIEPPDPEHPDMVFPRAGWASLRSGWEQPGTMIALQCSSAAQGHSHMDQNNVLIYRHGQELAMDCGYASALGGTLREFARGAVGHNCILVDGKGQSHKRGNVPFFASSREIGYVMGDATAAYDTTLLTRAHRHLVYLKPDLLLMVDDLRAAGGARRFSWLLHPHSWISTAAPEATVTLDGRALTDGDSGPNGLIELTKADVQMAVRHLVPEMEVTYHTHLGAEKYNPYIESITPPVEAIVLPTLLQFGPDRAENIETDRSGDVLTVRCDFQGRRWEVRLRLVSDDGIPPALTVVRDGETLFSSDDLAVAPTMDG